MLIGVSFLEGLGALTGIRCRFLEPQEILNVIFDMRSGSVCVPVGACRVMPIVEIKRCLAGTVVLGVVIGEF